MPTTTTTTTTANGQQVVLVTGASSGFGALTARALADAGHTVYASMRATHAHNADKAADATKYATDNDVDIRPIELDVVDQHSIDGAVETIHQEQGHIDVVMHNAGHMVTGPTEAFTPEQLADLYDINVLSTQRVNRAVLPAMRARGDGMLLWISSTSVKGGTPPYLGPYFAAKAAMDSLAVSYAAEVARFGIETSIIVPGAFTQGTNHFENSGGPDDDTVAKAYDERYAGLMADVSAKLAHLAPDDAPASMVSDEIVRVVALPKGERPFRTTIDPANDGSEEVSDVADRIRAEFLERIDLADLLSPAS